MLTDIERQEHYFIKQAEKDNLLDTTVRRWLHYDAKQLTLAPEYNFNDLQHPEKKTGIDVLEYTVPVLENSYVTRVIEYLPQNLINVNQNSHLPDET